LQLRATIAGASLLVPLAIALVIRIAMTPPALSEPPTAQLVPTCDSTRFAGRDKDCGPGTRCIANQCRALRLDRPANNVCSEHTCSGDKECFHGACTASDELPVAAPACQDSEALVRAIQQLCSIDQTIEDTKITSCRDEHLKRLTDDGSREGMLYELPDAFTVHFPAGEPRSSGRRSELDRQALIDDLSARLEPLQSAKAIFVFGRASAHTGDDTVNQALADRRASTVARSLHDVLAATGPTGAATTPTIIEWSLAAKSALDLRVLQKAVRGRPLTWRGAAREGLSAFFARDVDPNTIPADELDDFRDLINQVVFVVPLPCDGTEYFPRPSLPAMSSQLGKTQ